ncbi:MAG TPA: class I SAM-dependent methyltransferase, partial [Candidatus Sulfotelmatobacter sp.]|nr:class I SAM-dependent methyltransferase [Candidatus Sulfotelmatobacter sp.]
MTKHEQWGVVPTHAQILTTWQPDEVLRKETLQYPFQRALGLIVKDVFKHHVRKGGTILEIGAGQGYLKELVPQEYHHRYITSDYNVDNLIAGKTRRELSPLALSATDLSVIPDNSLDTVVALDTYHLLPNLQDAMNEAARVLNPNGTFIVFQASAPVEAVWHDHPDKVFIPTGIGTLKGLQLVGIERDEFRKGLRSLRQQQVDPLIIEKLAGFMEDQLGGYMDATRPNPDGLPPNVYDFALSLMPVKRFGVPSSYDYFKQKLDRATTAAGLVIQQSDFPVRNYIGRRSENHRQYPGRNDFKFDRGDIY